MLYVFTNDKSTCKLYDLLWYKCSQGYICSSKYPITALFLNWSIYREEINFFAFVLFDGSVLHFHWMKKEKYSVIWTDIPSVQKIIYYSLHKLLHFNQDTINVN